MSSTDRAVQVYQLRIWIRKISPQIWRRLLVRSDSTIAQLHGTLQIAFGWRDDHLHQFIVPGTHESTYYGEPSPEDEYFHKDDRLVRLAHIAPKKGATFLYEYDFGDCWKHEVTVEDISPTPKDEPPYPWCLDGQRACPPEDVGGVSGYANFLEAWRKRSHPEHQQMRQWVGKHFQPELFSVPQVNAGLALFISLEQVLTHEARRLCLLLSGEFPGSFSIWEVLAGKMVRKNVMTPSSEHRKWGWLRLWQARCSLEVRC